MKRLRAVWLRLVVHVAALVPLLLLALAYIRGRLGFDPVREITLRTGRYGMVLLILSLACTPVAVVMGFKRVLRVRRALGLYAFLYTGLHLLTFAGLDYGFRWRPIGEAILQKRFVQVGLATFLMLLPLAITSTDRWVKRLGKNWKRLHRLVYAAAILDVLHFVWVVKAGNPRPLPYAVFLALLLVVRLRPVREALVGLRKRLARGR